MTFPLPSGAIHAPRVVRRVLGDLTWCGLALESLPRLEVAERAQVVTCAECRQIIHDVAKSTARWAEELDR